MDDLAFACRHVKQVGATPLARLSPAWLRGRCLRPRHVNRGLRHRAGAMQRCAHQRVAVLDLGENPNCRPSRHRATRAREKSNARSVQLRAAPRQVVQRVVCGRVSCSARGAKTAIRVPGSLRCPYRSRSLSWSGKSVARRMGFACSSVVHVEPIHRAGSHIWAESTDGAISGEIKAGGGESRNAEKRGERSAATAKEIRNGGRTVGKRGSLCVPFVPRGARSRLTVVQTCPCVLNQA
jgi:hypothetical protein